MQIIKRLSGLLAISLLASSVAFAGGHEDGGKKKLGQFSGFEGKEAELGAAVAAAIAEASPTKGPEHDFSDREDMLGRYVSTAIKTLNHNRAYQHEMNDALVKMTLNHIQFAKDQGLLEEAARADAQSQFPMLIRVKKMIESSGNPDLALVAIAEQTTCFFQLIDKTDRAPGSITFRAPYGNVLAQTRRLGMHDLTEQEIHEDWFMPHIDVWGEIMGVDMQVTEWSDDGMVTVSVPGALRPQAAVVH